MTIRAAVWTVWVACSVLLGAIPLFAQVPHLVRYQGQAVDSKGAPLEGPYTLTFRLYDAQTGGTELWEEPQVNVQIEQGHFSVLLGQVTALTGVNWAEPCWLSVQVNVDPELTPRQRITSVPLALRAEIAESLSGGSGSVRVTHSMLQSIPDNIFTPLAFDTEHWDTDDLHDPVVNNTRLTAKTAGKYLIFGNVHLTYNTNGARILFIRVNGGVGYVARHNIVTGPNNDYNIGAIATVAEMNAGSYAELLVYQSSGQTLSTAGKWYQAAREFGMVKLQ